MHYTESSPHDFCHWSILFVVTFIVPATFRRGERIEVQIGHQDLPLSGHGRRCSRWREDDVELNHTCAESIHCMFILSFMDEVVGKFKASDDGSAFQMLYVVQGLQEDSVWIIPWQWVHLVRLRCRRQCFRRFGSLSGNWILNRIFLFILIILTLFLRQLPSILLTHHFPCDLFLCFMIIQTNRTRR